ncbi:MAG: T9SS type A sorting domain-containing protein [Bacteroidia bacterium]|nr:T9SS type A sorting domain-containing protein [Bacteroidia bacterium]MCX7651464.1 T9SS type A sorting domain-containing protein [Bacteroidia bacterium]MDW8416781.1 T9SS type A sorting domain-containing protein [Bacteroidia bacterium]
MRVAFISVLGLAAMGSAQRIKAVFGVLEGNGVSYLNSGLYYRWEDISDGTVSSFLGSTDIEPFANDLAYDPKTKLLFVVGGMPRGSVYAFDIWHSTIELPTSLDSIEARRIAIKDTLLLVTRARAPFFTAYRIAYNAQNGTLSLDSLWSPSHSLLRSVPEGILVWGDTAFICLSYEPNTFVSDSIVLAINLLTKQVVASWEVEANPSEIVRVKDSLYVACYGDFSHDLNIARIQPSNPTVQIWSAGDTSYGGFVTDTSGVRDTILFWGNDGSLRGFNTKTGSPISGAYLGIASSGSPFFSYGLLWVGNQLHMSFTNFIDTSLIIMRDPTYVTTPPYTDTIFVSNGLGGIGYPSLRRFIYVEDDTSRGTTTSASVVDSHSGSFRYDAMRGLLIYDSLKEISRVWIWNATGQLMRYENTPASQIYIGGLPSGVYFVTATTLDGRVLSHRFWKP